MAGLFGGCVAYRYDTQSIPSPVDVDECEHCRIQKARSHWLYTFVPRHRCQIRPFDVGHWMLWSLFGNDDDGIFGEEPTANFRADAPPTFCKAFLWNWRNPLHNFCFYVIGSADRCNDEWTLIRLTPSHSELCVYRPRASTVFAGNRSSFYLGLHGLKPFLSTRIVWSDCYESRFYIGWRCRGNFGLRWNPFGHRKQEKQSAIQKCDDPDTLHYSNDEEDSRDVRR